MQSLLLPLFLGIEYRHEGKSIEGRFRADEFLGSQKSDEEEVKQRLTGRLSKKGLEPLRHPWPFVRNQQSLANRKLETTRGWLFANPIVWTMAADWMILHLRSIIPSRCTGRLSFEMKWHRGEKPLLWSLKLIAYRSNQTRSGQWRMKSRAEALKIADNCLRIKYNHWLLTRSSVYLFWSISQNPSRIIDRIYANSCKFTPCGVTEKQLTEFNVPKRGISAVDNPFNRISCKHLM